MGDGGAIDEKLSWPNAARAVIRNATILRAIALVIFVCLAIVLSTLGIYLRSWRLQFKIGELKDYVTIQNEPDNACEGNEPSEWAYGPLETFAYCEARQRQDYTQSDKDLFDQCLATHKYARQKTCTRGTEVRIYVFNVTNPQDVVEGLTPRITEIGRKEDGGPFIFYKDCRTFNTEFGQRQVAFNDYCYYTYKYSDSEFKDLRQEVVVPNVGLLQAIGASIDKIDYIIGVVWGTLALDYLNATTTSTEDYIRGQLLSFTWPNDFGAHFMNEYSPALDRAGQKAKDNAKALYEMVLDFNQDTCMVNGTQYDRNQCTSMANVLSIYARRYYESFQTYTVHPYKLTYKQGAGLFVKATIGDLLGYFSGYEDPLSAYLFPKKVSWEVVTSHTQVGVDAAARAGSADSKNGFFNPGPLGKSIVVSNGLDELGWYKEYQGRKYIIEFDWQGCRPLAPSGQVVVPPHGPYPPQCSGGNPMPVNGSRGFQVPPRLWSVQPSASEVKQQKFFSKTLMRPLTYSWVEDIELEADIDFVKVRRFELSREGLEDARVAFNCEEVYKNMAEAGVVNRGSDCDEHVGMFDLGSLHGIPYVWSLPHYYMVESKDPSQHPRNNLQGFVTPTGPRYRNLITIEPESGKVLEMMDKEQLSVRLYQDERNYFFTKHKRVVIPLFWKHETRNATIAERQLLAGFQNEFQGLHAGFIACICLGAASLLTALFFGMLLYRDSSLQQVQEKRKKIQAELEAALPPGHHQEEEEAQEQDGFANFM